MSGFIARQFSRLLYVSLLGPPHAVRLHDSAQGTGGELDGRPLWTVAVSEYVLRAGMLLVLSWGFQELIGHLAFRRYKVFFFLTALWVAGTLHTASYYMCYGALREKWPLSRLLKLYRLGRNLSYAVIPAFAAAGVALLWQEFQQIPLFKGELVFGVFKLSWLVMMLLGTAEALLVRRTPSGLQADTELIHPSRNSAQ